MERVPRLKDWMSIATHMHGRLGVRCPSNKERSLEAARHDSQIEIDALVRYAQKFSGRENVLITDTDHPVQIIDRNGLDRGQVFKPENLALTRDVISRGVSQRAAIVKSSPFGKNVLTGVEADLVSIHGELDVNQSALAGLDVVLASFHYRIFKAANNATAPTKDEFLNAYLGALRNPYVDILAHPLRDIQLNVLSELQPSDWNHLAEHFLKNRNAFEISFYGWRPYQSSDPKKAAERQAIKQLAEKGVLFSLGIDFHDFQEYGCSPDPDTVVTMENVDSLFAQNKANGSHRNLLKRVRSTIQELQSLGVSSSQVVNSSEDRFMTWLKSRRQAA